MDLAIQITMVTSAGLDGAIVFQTDVLHHVDVIALTVDGLGDALHNLHVDIVDSVFHSPMMLIAHHDFIQFLHE